MAVRLPRQTFWLCSRQALPTALSICHESHVLDRTQNLRFLQWLNSMLCAMQVPNFPFPLPPEPQALRQAQQCLVAMGALQGDDCALSQTGRAMAGLPLSPRHARMLLQVGYLTLYFNLPHVYMHGHEHTCRQGDSCQIRDVMLG